MRRDALDLVREATDAGLHVSLSPSATGKLMNTDFAEIKAAGVERISLSLDGATRERFTGVIRDEARVMSERLRDLAAQSSHDIALAPPKSLKSKAMR